MDNIDNENLLKLCYRFNCKICQYKTDKKSSYESHKLSARHNKKTTNDVDSASASASDSACAQLTHKYKCNNCEKPFNDRAGLWRHKKKCSVINDNAIDTDLNKNEIIIMLIQQNKEFKELLIEQNTQINKQMIELAKNSNCITNNNNINTTNNNQSFNMNIFLNEKCKDALNIGEFVNTLPLTLEDLENTGKVGYVKGITDIVVRGLKEMDVHKRPIHCSDLKREVIYVKDNDVWHKDEDNVKVKKAIQNIGTRNYRQVKEWIEKYPEAKDISTKKHEQYVQIRLKCTGGSDTAEDDKMQNKILSNIAKLVHINK